MQNAQDVNWLLELLKIIGTGLVSALITGLWLNIRTERIKSELQARLYEFQTRFSIYQQRKAEAIKNVFTSFVEIEIQLNEINNFTNWLAAFDGNFKNEDVRQKAIDIRDKSLEKLKELELICNSNCIYFDFDTSKEIEEIKSFFSELIQSNVRDINTRNGLDNGFIGVTFLNGSSELKHLLLEEKIKINKCIEEKWVNLKEKLDRQFRQLLSTEATNYKIVKKQ
jgi:hypothetical protein